MTPMTLWLSILGALLLGAALGGVGALVVLRRQYGDQDTVRSLQRELEAYRREVAEHYAETAKRVDNLTQAYKSVHDHLEDGAYRLVGEEELRQRLHNTTSDPVTLEGIGPREGPRELRDRRDEAAEERADPPKNEPAASANHPDNGAPTGPAAESTRRASHADAPTEPEKAGANGDKPSDARAGVDEDEPERSRSQEAQADSDQDEPTPPREPRART